MTVPPGAGRTWPAGGGQRLRVDGVQGGLLVGEQVHPGLVGQGSALHGLEGGPADDVHGVEVLRVEHAGGENGARDLAHEPRDGGGVDLPAEPYGLVHLRPVGAGEFDEQVEPGARRGVGLLDGHLQQPLHGAEQFDPFRGAAASLALRPQHVLARQVRLQQGEPVVGLAQARAQPAERRREVEVVLGVAQGFLGLRAHRVHEVDDELDLLATGAGAHRPQVLDHLAGGLDLGADVQVLSGEQLGLESGPGAQVLAAALVFLPAEDVEALREFDDAARSLPAEDAQGQGQRQEQTAAAGDEDQRGELLGRAALLEGQVDELRVGAVRGRQRVQAEPGVEQGVREGAEALLVALGDLLGELLQAHLGPAHLHGEAAPQARSVSGIAR